MCADVATDDVVGLAAGLLTARGGRTSHAAVVARQLNKVCIVGCQNLVIPADGGERRLGSQPLREGTLLSLDGHTGRVHAGRLEAKTERPTAYLEEVQRWKERLGTPPVEFPTKSGHGVNGYSVCSYSAGETYPSEECRRLVL